MVKSLANTKIKLFIVLQNLSTAQLSKLRKLIGSPYFHKTDGVIQLFSYLRKFHPQYPLKKVSDEAIARQLFPEVNNGAKKVKNFKTDLIKLIEQFLIQQQFSEQESQQKYLLAQAYQELQLPDYSDSAIKKVTQLLEKSTAKGLPYHYQKMQLMHFQYYHPNTSTIRGNQKMLQDLLDQLDHYFIQTKYKYAHEALERMARLNEHFELRFWEKVQTEAIHFEDSEKQSPIYYYQQFQQLAAQNGGDEKSFKKLKNHFFKNLEFLSLEDQQSIFRYLLNYVSKSLNSGISQLAPLQFDLYKNGLSNNLVILKGRIPVITFLNIVVIASTCKAFDWLEDFITNYQTYLNPAIKEDVVKTASAIAAFHQEDTAKVLGILNETHFKNQSLELFCFPLEVKSIFEFFLQDQTYYSVMISRLDSLAKKVSNKYDFAAKKKEEYLNYIHFVQSIVRSFNESKNNTSTIKDIRIQITSTKHLIHKSWLLEKCDQIIKRNEAPKK
jgi:hypothetical protein